MAGWGTMVARSLAAAAGIGAVLSLGGTAVAAKTIIDEWHTVEVPPPPKLERVTVDPKTTALLVLDLVPITCNDKRRPRCVASLPEVAKLIKGARESNTTVIYSSIFGPKDGTAILPPVKPLGDEPLVRAHADKFIGTDLEKILTDKGIKTVIVVGTTAEGAVLYTASHAAFLGFNVVVPVDGMSAGLKYAEQYVAWDLTHAPGVGAKVKLTTIGMLKY